jgi:hypothetical protein
MGKVTAIRQAGATLEVRTNVKTRHVRLAHERPVRVDLSQLGATPALTELFLSTESSLEALDLAPLAGHPALESITAHVATPCDLAPLASCRRLRSVSLTIDDGIVDFTPLHGHPALEHVGVTCAGDQPSFDLGFARALPALSNLSLAGGEWRRLDLEPLRGLPLQHVYLTKQYISKIDLALFAQPALESLMLQDLEINEGYLDTFPLARCTRLRFLSLMGAEVGTFEVTGLAKLANLQRFDPPNAKTMVMMAKAQPIASPGLLRWRDHIGVD